MQSNNSAIEYSGTQFYNLGQNSERLPSMSYQNKSWEISYFLQNLMQDSRHQLWLKAGRIYKQKF